LSGTKAAGDRRHRAKISAGEIPLPAGHIAEIGAPPPVRARPKAWMAAKLGLSITPASSIKNEGQAALSKPATKSGFIWGTEPRGNESRNHDNLSNRNLAALFSKYVVAQLCAAPSRGACRRPTARPNLRKARPRRLAAKCVIQDNARTFKPHYQATLDLFHFGISLARL
jgi:hypothetical protein